MKWMLTVFTLLSCGIAFAHQDPPPQIRVCVQFIEVSHPDLTEMLVGEDSSGSVLHDKALALSKEGKAKILETCLVLGLSGRKFTLESIREEIYPTEYDPPGSHSHNPIVNGPLASATPNNPMLRSITAFATRNTGVTVEVEPTMSHVEGFIDLRIAPQVVTPLRLETWMEHKDRWGDGSIRMPIYETWRANTSLSVKRGKFELVSTITPKPTAPAPAASRKILLFVRADVVKPATN